MNPVDPKRVAIVGFCYGGAAAARAAAARPDAVRACGVFYGKPPSDGGYARWRGVASPCSRCTAPKIRNFPPKPFEISKRRWRKTTWTATCGGTKDSRTRLSRTWTPFAGAPRGTRGTSSLAFLRTHTEE